MQASRRVSFRSISVLRNPSIGGRALAQILLCFVLAWVIMASLRKLVVLRILRSKVIINHFQLA
jgi:hypothetical protein